MRGGPLIFISNFSSLAQEHSTMPLVEEKRMLEMHFVYGKSIYLVLYPDLQRDTWTYFPKEPAGF